MSHDSYIVSLSFFTFLRRVSALFLSLFLAGKSILCAVSVNLECFFQACDMRNGQQGEAEVTLLIAYLISTNPIEPSPDRALQTYFRNQV